jgi:S-adenosylmethionine-diacylglycerol 3-amino-3-carboxypropyl transferase
LINGHPNDTNYFAWQALHRSYPGPGDRCLPPYLQSSQFERMRNGAGLIIPVHANLRLFLESLPAREVDAVVLLDSQDWMAPEEIRALWNAIDRTGSDNVRVIFRTAGAESPLESAELAPSCASGAVTRNEAPMASSATGQEFMAGSTATHGAD